MCLNNHPVFQVRYGWEDGLVGVARCASVRGLRRFLQYLGWLHGFVHQVSRIDRRPPIPSKEALLASYAAYLASRKDQRRMAVFFLLTFRSFSRGLTVAEQQVLDNCCHKSQRRAAFLRSVVSRR